MYCLQIVINKDRSNKLNYASYLSWPSMLFSNYVFMTINITASFILEDNYKKSPILYYQYTWITI